MYNVSIYMSRRKVKFFLSFLGIYVGPASHHQEPCHARFLITSLNWNRSDQIRPNQSIALHNLLVLRVPRPTIAMDILAVPVLRIVGTALLRVPRLLGPLAQRPLPQHTVRDVLVFPLGGDEGLGGLALFHPRHQRQQLVVRGVRVAGRAVRARAEVRGLVGAGEVPGRGHVVGRAGAVLHAGDDEEAVEIVEVDAAGLEGLLDLAVEVDGGAGGDEAVGGAVVVDELAAAGVEGAEVEVCGGGVAGAAGRSGEGDGAVVGGRRVPGRVVEDEVLHELAAVGGGFVGAHEEGPLLFAAELEAGEDEGVVGAAVVGVKLLQSVQLVRGQAFGFGLVADLVLTAAEEGFGDEAAAGGVGDDAVFQTVLPVALGHDFFGDHWEGRGRDAAGGVGWEVQETDPETPGLKTVGPPCGSTGENTIESLRVKLDFTQSLATSGAAAGEVGVLGLSIVVSFSNLTSHDCRTVDGAVAPVLTAFLILQRPR